MKNSADLEGCYPPRPLASVNNIITPSSICRILHILRKPNSIIANYLPLLKLQISISGPGCTLEVIKCLNLNYWKQFFRILLLIMNRYSTLLINIYFFLTWSAHHSRILAVTTVTGYSPSSMTALF